MKTSKCGAVMHDVRNGLLSIQGLVLCLGRDDPRVVKINNQITRIANAINNCDNYNSGCANCENGESVCHT